MEGASAEGGPQCGQTGGLQSPARAGGVCLVFVSGRSGPAVSRRYRAYSVTSENSIAPLAGGRRYERSTDRLLDVFEGPPRYYLSVVRFLSLKDFFGTVYQKYIGIGVDNLVNVLYFYKIIYR